MIRFCAASAIAALSAAFILFGQTSSGQAESVTAQAVPEPVCARFPLTETDALWVEMSKLADILNVSTTLVDEKYEIELMVSGESMYKLQFPISGIPEICRHPSKTMPIAVAPWCSGSYEATQFYIQQSVGEGPFMWAILAFSRSPTVRSECFAEGAPQYGDPTAVTQRIFRNDTAQLYLEITEPR